MIENVLVVIMLSIACAGAFAATHDMKQLDLLLADPPPRQVQIAGAATIPAVENGTSSLEIVVAPDAVKVVRFAASELQQYLQQSFGAPVPIVAAPSTGKTSILLGDQPMVRDAGIKAEEIIRDGFMIKGKGNRIYIAGRDDAKADPATARAGWATFFERGTLFGVYDFLERFIGVRFYFPGEIGTVVPRHKNLKLPEMTIFDRPDYPRRRTTAGTAEWFPEVDRNLEAVNWYRMRLETFYVPCCHSLERMKFVERFGESHPECFALDASGKRMIDKGSPYYGNLCYTDPGFREELYKDAVAFLTGQPASSRGLKNWDPSALQPGFFNIMPKDHFRKCLCQRCQDFYAKHSEAELVWDLVADIAGRLQKNGISGYVTAMSYGHYPNPPAGKLPDNVRVMVSARGPWAENDPKVRVKYDDLISAWKKRIGHKPWLWTAVYKYGGLELPNIPSTTPKAVASFFECKSPDICGTFMESETDHWLFGYLNYYFMAKSTWNNSLDYRAALKEHHRLMFGAGAPPMEKFFDRVEDIWAKQIAGRIVDTPLGSQAVPPSDYELWERLYSPEQMREFDNLFAQAAKLAQGDKDAEKRIQYFEKYFLGQIRKGAEAYQQTKQAISDWNYVAVPLRDAEKITVDGVLNESAWTSVTDAYLLPIKSDYAEVYTRFKVRSDAQYLYFAVQCDEPNMNEIAADCIKRDDPDLWRDSVVELFLNPSCDRVNYYHWIINSNGAVWDCASKRLGASSSMDEKWNSKIEVKTSKGASNWLVEGRIPLSELAGFDSRKCIANIGRHRVIKSKAKVPLYSWSPYIKGFHDIENFGTILFEKPGAKAVLLKNGDFTEPLKGRAFGPWYAGQEDVTSGQVGLDKQVFRVGGQALKIEGKDGDRHCVTQYLPELKPNTKYHLTFQVRTQDVKKSGTSFGGAVVNIAAPVNTWYPKNPYLGTMPWTSQGWFFTTPAETKQNGYIRLWLYSATGTVWFDNLRLEEVK